MKGVLGVNSRSQGKKTPLWWCRLRISAFRVPTRSHQTYEHTKSHARRNWQKNQTGTRAVFRCIACSAALTPPAPPSQGGERRRRLVFFPPLRRGDTGGCFECLLSRSL